MTVGPVPRNCCQDPWTILKIGGGKYDEKQDMCIASKYFPPRYFLVTEKNSSVTVGTPWAALWSTLTSPTMMIKSTGATGGSPEKGLPAASLEFLPDMQDSI